MVVPLLLVVAGLVLWSKLSAASGDPGGKVLAELVPAASALPGYGTSDLPWRSDPRLDGPYIVKTEPFHDSQDGMPGTECWSKVVVQAGFRWTGGSASLFSQVGERLVALGWSPNAVLSTTEADWTKQLHDGSQALAALDLDPTGPPWWEFVVTAPAVGKAC